MTIGGSALSNGIMLQDEHNRVITRRLKDDTIDIKIEATEFVEIKNDAKNIVNYIPIIRGIYNILVTNNIRFIRILILVTILSDILSLFSQNTSISKVYEGLAFGYIVFFIVFMIYIFSKLKNYLQYHGAEHKVINAYENQLPIQIDSIRKCSRVSYRCGTIQAIFLVLSFMLLGLIPSEFISFTSVKLLLGIGIAYELSHNDILYNIGFKYLFVVGGFIQKYLTTMDPNDQQLEIGIVCLNKLLELRERG
jgi:uncharacterized protein YqhQ